MRLSIRTALITVAAVCAVSTSALAGSHSSCPVQGGTLKYGVKAEPPSYDMHATNSYAVMHFVAQHYSTLLTFDWKNFPKLEGDLAESWSMADDGLSYTFNLQKGVKFHDGTPFTSADVKASYDRMRNPPEGVTSVRKALFASISDIETPDDHTVIFNLSSPDAFMMDGFASPFNAIYSAKDLAADPTFPVKNVNGTGPYMLDEHVKGEAYKAVRYADFHHGDNCLDETIGYRIKGIVEPMVGGQIMAEWRGVAPPERKSLEEQMGDDITFQEKQLMTAWVVSLNSEFEAFKDRRVRQAMNLCIDRHGGLPKLAKITFVAPRPSGFLLYDTKFALPDEELFSLVGYGSDAEANRAEGMRLLKEAGYEGLEFTYSNRAVSHPYDHIAIWLMSEWKKCGMNPNMITNPTSKFVQIRKEGGFDATIDWAPSFLPDPTLMHFKYLSDDKTGSNYSNYTDRELDELFDAQKGETDFEKRKALVHAFEKKALEDAYVLPVTYTDRVVPMHKSVKGFTIAFSHILNNTYRGVYLEN
jgi:peptide/nickel transport system substrate-binding protein